MIKIAICAASQSDRKRISVLCDNFFDDKFMNYELLEYASGESLLVEDFPDVLFLDTEAGKIGGLLVKEILSKMKAETRIIFISNCFEKMQQAFGKNVYGFLEKPFVYEMLCEKMLLVLEDYVEKNRSIFCKYKDKIEKIYYKDILYVKACGRYTKVFIRGQEYYMLCDQCMGDWYLEAENTELASCHRSYLVNMSYIEKVSKDIEMMNGEHIPLGKKHIEEFWDAYKSYIRSSVRDGKRDRAVY